MVWEQSRASRLCLEVSTEEMSWARSEGLEWYCLGLGRRSVGRAGHLLGRNVTSM